MPVDCETIALAHRLVGAAGAAIRPYFRKPIALADKRAAPEKAFDPVTVADTEAEQAIRVIVERERPDNGILGEEFGEKPSANGLRWVIDPVDGTGAFVSGRYEWGSLIALEENGRAVLGIPDQPVLRERFVGVNGESAMLTEGERLRLQTRSCPDLSEVLLCATNPDAFLTAGERAAFERIRRAVRMTRFGGDCYLFAALALGFVDLVVEAGFNRWDVAALIPIVEGAGGKITNWQGGCCDGGGQILAAGDIRVHAEAIDLLAG